MKGSIASPHWEACATCKRQKKDGGCHMNSVSLSLHRLGDWIICDDYLEEREDSKDD